MATSGRTVAVDRPGRLLLRLDISPRAAWRLERFGFTDVVECEAGKMDWLSYGLPHDGSALLAGALVDHTVARCELDAPLSRARALAEEHGEEFCVAVTDTDVVMGVVAGPALGGPADRRVEEAMAFGVSTVRPSEDVGALAQRMKGAGVEMILVTSSAPA